MTNPVMQVFRQVDADEQPVGRGCWMWCPGCEMAHRPQIVGEDGSVPDGPVWEWDGNLDAPTFSPSLLVHHSAHLCGTGVVHYEACPDSEACDRPGHYLSPDGPAHVQFCERWGDCHSFIRAGRWEFLPDCAHALAGQTVAMVPLPDWLTRGT